MNIQITHSHLLEFLDTNATPKQLVEYLSLCGPSIESVEKIGDDYIYDIEITTNRVDMMSVMGIARDAATILPQFNIKAKFIPPQLATITKPKKSLPITIKDSHKTCKRILGIVLDNVDLGPSKKHVQSRLKAAGIRSLNNAIDITNYIMTEIGHPTHVFDYDRIKTKKLILRKSKKGEKITSLENKTYTLPGGDNVIDDGTGNIVDLPGIIGTSNSIVIDNTKRILFFLETNDPVQIRKTSMTLGIRTVAATLNEKWVDPELAMVALKRGVKLFQELTGASIASEIIDIYPNPVKTKTITTKHQLIKDRLGVDISQSNVKNILTSLGFDNQYQESSDQYTIAVPSFRQKDVSIPEDIVEEVARIYGYHKLPSILMDTPIPTNYPNQNFNLEYQIKAWLAGQGFTELYTNSMISKKLALDSHLPLDSHLKIKNALSEDWQYLRKTLIPSHLEAIAQNPHLNSVSFFEIANTYHQASGKLPEERLHLLINTTKDYLYLKGIVEALLDKLHLSPTFSKDLNPHKGWVKESASIITCHSTQVGSLGSLLLENTHPYPQTNASIFSVKKLATLSNPYPTYQPVSKHPPMIEDLTFTLLPKTLLGPVIETIKSTHQLITKVTLTKTYQQNYTFNITYQSLDKPLSDTLITPIRKKIVTNLKTKHKATLVGTL